jgi:O-antigen/teichoic acid export membrane protein
MFLAAFHGEAVVGIYGIAYKIIDVVTMIPVMLMGLLLPSLTTFWKEKNKVDFSHFLQKAFDFFMILAIPIAIGAQVVATPLSVFIGGSEFSDSGSILRILILATLGLFISSLYGHTIVAIEKQKPMAWGYAITAVLTLIGYLIFIPPFGMQGAAMMTLFSEFLIAILTFIVVFRTTHIRPKFLITFKVLLSSLFMYLILVALPPWPVLLQIAIGGLAYGMILFGLGGVKIITIRQLLSKRENQI